MNPNRSGYPADSLSVTQLNLYLMCPLKFRYQYVDRLPKPFKPVALVFGGAIHSAIEWWHRKRMESYDPEPKEVARIFRADFHAQKTGDIAYKNGDTEEDLIDKGGRMLAVYVREYRGGPVRQIELPFRVPLIDKETGETLDLPLDGYIDLLEADGTIVELKTSGKAFSPIEIAQHLQLTGYSYAYEQLYGRPPRLRLDCLTKTRNPALIEYDAVRTANDHVRFFHMAKSVVSAVRNCQYYPRPGWQCSDCEYFDPCQKWRSGNGVQPQRANNTNRTLVTHVT